MNTFIVGGTGFLGYYTILELLAHGHRVSTLALTPPPAEVVFPEQVNLTLADLNQKTDDELVRLLQGHEGLIFAAGVDDRVVPKKPAWPFFHKYNVEGTARLIKLAKRAGVKRAVIFSSYFVEFNRSWPELNLAEKHPYIRSREEQIDASLSEAGEELNLSFLLLPYIFGVLPGRAPLWKPLIGYLNSFLPWIFYTKGGTAMVAVQEVAAAAVAALERGQHGSLYPIASQNLSWVEFLARLGYHLRKPKPIYTLPNWIAKVGMWLVELTYKLKGRQSGLEPVSFVDLQTRLTYLDTHSSQVVLNYPTFDLDQALAETVRACVNNKPHEI